MTEHNASDIPVRPVRMTKSRAEKAKFIEIAPGKHIEASVSMRKLEKRIVRLCAMACTDYGMIKDGDKIAVAMSGGKDSYVLLDALLKLKARAPVHFDIIAVHVNQHIPGSPTHLLEAWLKEKGVAYHIENQDTYSITQKLIPSGKTSVRCAPACAAASSIASQKNSAAPRLRWAIRWTTLSPRCFLICSTAAESRLCPRCSKATMVTTP